VATPPTAIPDLAVTPSATTPDLAVAPPAAGDLAQPAPTGGTQNTGAAQSDPFEQLKNDVQAQETALNASDAAIVCKGLDGAKASLLAGDYPGALDQTKQVGDFLKLELLLMGSNSLVNRAVANDYDQLYAGVQAIYNIWNNWRTTPLPGYEAGINPYPGLTGANIWGYFDKVQDAGSAPAAF
jgi:hypothetical protein